MEFDYTGISYTGISYTRNCGTPFQFQEAAAECAYCKSMGNPMENCRNCGAPRAKTDLAPRFPPSTFCRDNNLSGLQLF